MITRRRRGGESRWRQRPRRASRWGRAGQRPGSGGSAVMGRGRRTAGQQGGRRLACRQCNSSTEPASALIEDRTADGVRDSWAPLGSCLSRCTPGLGRSPLPTRSQPVHSCLLCRIRRGHRMAGRSTRRCRHKPQRGNRWLGCSRCHWGMLAHESTARTPLAHCRFLRLCIARDSRRRPPNICR